MWFLWKLFRRRPQAGSGEGISPVVAESIAALKAQAQPCLRLVPGGDGRSRLGGTPEMAGVWPRYEGRPLACVAQLDLAQIQAAGGPEWLPGDGRLLFFYELEHGSWGLDEKDAGSAVVIHEAGSPIAATEPSDLPDDAKSPAYPITFELTVSYPSDDRAEIDWNSLDTASADALEEVLVSLDPAAPAHQIGGYPSPVQSDGMEAECETVARRLGHGGGDPADWRLLLQFDTDLDAGMMWCDVGCLYFWIRERDARAGDFSKVWVILQSN
ncbi:MAG: YwqG family protein [Phenylobacterium sp.]|uniref:YwqG family protein n=1 Tax=Phenylobacterium sp. TaxID=1871053 RepID=UPI0027319E2F|nr:YwqG family protein [Phenylobacterium sp.]MDP2011382.1 YwqG family protein [Phenylobacterium sp.]MDP3632409.1 YwqG family protein [Phenylobacterium sp.]